MTSTRCFLKAAKATAIVALTALQAMPAWPITGSAPPATGWAARAIVMILDEREDLCTGAALASDLILTAAHCVVRSGAYKIRLYQTGQMVPVKSIVRHPGFDPHAYSASRATADIALLKLTAPLPDIVAPAALASSRRVGVGDRLAIAGFGVTVAGTSKGLGVPRMTTLTVTGRPGSLQVRLVDPKAANLDPGEGACTGDSGAPAFDGNGPFIVGVVSWSTAPRDDQGCGGLTGLTPLVRYQSWIVRTAKSLGSFVKEPTQFSPR